MDEFVQSFNQTHGLMGPTSPSMMDPSKYACVRETKRNLNSWCIVHQRVGALFKVSMNAMFKDCWERSVARHSDLSLSGVSLASSLLRSRVAPPMARRQQLRQA